MRRTLRLAALMLAMTGAAALALEPPVLLDFGDRNQAVEDGFIAAGSEGYDAARGFGWEGRSGYHFADRHSPEVPTYHRAGEVALYDLVRDCLTIIGPNSFRIDVPDGAYDVTVWVGDLSMTETRPDLWVTVGADAVMAGETTFGGQVRELTFPTQVTGGALRIEFDGRGPQKYLPVVAIAVRALDAPREFAVAARTIPEEPGTPEDYLLNWRMYLDELQADWEQAQRDLQAAGRWSDDWAARLAELRAQPGYRPVYASGTSMLERMAMLAGAEPDATDLIAVLQEVGLDGLTSRDLLLTRAQVAAGMTPLAAAAGLEHLPADAEGISFIRILQADGTYRAIEGAYSPWDPAMTHVFARAWSPLANLAQYCDLAWIDEPRGAWGSGGIGDYSEPAQAAFRAWARVQGLDELAARGIPTPERSWDFYRFYRWRMSATAGMVARAWEPLGIDMRIVPGNGILGPETVNHNTMWPPSTVRAGMGVASWMYAGGRASAEVLRATERELGGFVLPFAALWQDPDQCVEQAALVASAGCREGLHLWQPGTIFNAIERPRWLAAASEITRMVQALSGLQHDAGLHLYCPDSLVYNDLVDFSRTEASRWTAVQDALQVANVDYRVTLTCDTPTPSVVLYAPVRAVLTDEEAAALIGHLDRGNTLIYACAGEPEYPDGSPLAALAQRLAAPEPGRVVRMANEFDPAMAADEAAALGLALNPRAANAGVLSFRFVTEGREVTLWLNTTGESVTEATPFAADDLLTGERIDARGQFTIPAHRYRLLEAAG